MENNVVSIAWFAAAMSILGCASGRRVPVADLIDHEATADKVSVDVPADMGTDQLIQDQVVDLLDVQGPGDSTTDTDSREVGLDVLDGGSDGMDVVVGPCDPLPELVPFSVEIFFDEGYWFDQEFKYDGPAHVVRPVPDTTFAGASGAEVKLYLVDLDLSATVKYVFPNHQRLPVVTGEEVQVEIWIQRPWWQTRYLMIRDLDGAPRAVVFSGADLIHSHSGKSVWFTQEATDCPGVSHACGPETRPRILLAWVFSAGIMPLNQGEVTAVAIPGGHYKLYGISSRKTDSNDQCADYPYQWVDLLVLGNHRHNQCHCVDHDDCTRAHRCETEVHRCVPDLCADMDCAGPCDPYLGVCHAPSDAPPSAPCQSSADCGVGPDCNMVCNTVLGWCVGSDCCLDGCFRNCSPLAKLCYGCLSDCDCSPEQTCRQSDRTCISCEPSKMNFDQTNTPMFEYFLICIPKDDPAKLSAVQDIVPEMTCGSGGVLANCSAAETACFGQFVGPWPNDGTKTLSDEDWNRLCRLSMLPFVSKIVGGHYL